MEVRKLQKHRRHAARKGDIPARNLDRPAIVKDCLRVCVQPPGAGACPAEIVRCFLARFPEVEMACQEVDGLVACTVERFGHLRDT